MNKTREAVGARTERKTPDLNIQIQFKKNPKCTTSFPTCLRQKYRRTAENRVGQSGAPERGQGSHETADLGRSLAGAGKQRVARKNGRCGNAPDKASSRRGVGDRARCPRGRGNVPAPSRCHACEDERGVRSADRRAFESECIPDRPPERFFVYRIGRRSVSSFRPAGRGRRRRRRRVTTVQHSFAPLPCLAALMLGARTRSASAAARRASCAGQVEQNEKSSNDERELKRLKLGERSCAQPEAAANLCDSTILQSTHTFAASSCTVRSHSLTLIEFAKYCLFETQSHNRRHDGRRRHRHRAHTVLSVKQRVFAANRTLFVRRQRLLYSAGPRGMEPLADDETLGGAGVAQDGSAELDVLLAAEAAELGPWARYMKAM